MNCSAFEDRLDALLGRGCSAGEWAAAERHLAGCPRCRRLLQAVGGEMSVLGADEDESLTRAILARTSGGAACARARDLLCDFIDGVLCEADRELVAAHTARCLECDQLAAALRELGLVLPAIASIEPPADLTASILRATTRRQPTRGIGDRVAELWSRAIERPRFSVEVAYVVTVVLVVLVGNPVAAFRDASTRAAAAVQPRVTRMAGRVAEPIASVRSSGEATLQAGQGVLATASAEVLAARTLFDRVVLRASSLWRIGETFGLRALVNSVMEIGDRVWRFWQELFGRSTLNDGKRQTGSS